MWFVGDVKVVLVVDVVDEVLLLVLMLLSSFINKFSTVVGMDFRLC